MSLPLRRHTDIIRAAVPLQCRHVLEVGCGGGRLLRWLAHEAGSAIGVDPDPAQIAQARATAPGVPLLCACGEALPFAGGSFDLVVCFNSLHHVPLTAQWQAAVEAARVLASGGHLLVIEPLAQGDWFSLLQPLDDETEVRREAHRTLAAAATLGLWMMQEQVYDSEIVEPTWDAARARFLAADPNRAGALAAIEPELARRFAALGRPVEGGRAFRQPMRLNLLRRQP